VKITGPPGDHALPGGHTVPLPAIRLAAVYLYRWERNALFEVIQDVGLPGCEIGVEKLPVGVPMRAESKVMIRHPMTGSWLMVSRVLKEYSVTYAVTDGPSRSVAALTDLDAVLRPVRVWAEETKYVAQHADLWAEAGRTSQLLSQDDNTPFAAGEQAEIARRLDEVKQLVRDRFELTDNQLASLDQRLDDASEAVTGIGRKTWLYTFYGAVMSAVITDEIPPHVVQTVVATVVHAVAHLFGVGSPPPVIGT
jgi:hypothetical protein